MYKTHFNKYDVLVFMCAIALIILFMTLNLERFYALFSFEWEDEAVENQILWNTVYGQPFYHSIKEGYFYGHVTPVYLILALGYFIWPHIGMWYLMSAVGVALGGIAVYKIGELELENSQKSFFIAVIYYLYAPLHYMMVGPIETIHFFIPFFLFCFYYYLRKQFKLFAVFAVLALACKESIAVVLVLLGLYAFLSGRAGKWVWWPVLLGCLWFIVATVCILPYVNTATLGLTEHAVEFNTLDPPSIISLIRFLIFSPGKAISLMFSSEHLELLGRILLPVCFLPLLSTVTLIGLPGFLQILLHKGALGHGNAYYLANIIPFVFLGLIYGLKNLERFLKRVRISQSWRNNAGWLILILSLNLCLVGAFTNNIFGEFQTDEKIADKRFLNQSNIFSPVFYKMDSDDRIAWSMIKLIPPEASVAASGDLLIPLSQRRRLLEFGYKKALKYNYFDVDYILLNRKDMHFGGGRYSRWDEQDMNQLNAYIREGKFTTIAEEGTFLLLKRAEN